MWLRRRPPRWKSSGRSPVAAATCSPRRRASCLAPRGETLDEARTRAAALCIEAGADVRLIPQWVEEGRRRAELARNPRSATRPRTLTLKCQAAYLAPRWHPKTVAAGSFPKVTGMTISALRSRERARCVPDRAVNREYSRLRTSKRSPDSARRIVDQGRSSLAREACRSSTGPGRCMRRG